MEIWDLNFWILGPLAFWFIGVGLYVNAYTQSRGTKRIIKAIETLTNQLGEDNTGLKKATGELQVDTFQLTNIIMALKEQLEKATASTEAWHTTLKKIYWYLPLGGDKK